MTLPTFEQCMELSPNLCDSGNTGDGTETKSVTWYWGVLLGILAALASNGGVNVQKYSMMKEALKTVARPYLKQPLWFAGLVLVILGSVFDFLALAFAPQSLVITVGGFTMVANLIFCKLLLGEIITRTDLIGTVLIVIGIILACIFSDKNSQCFTLDQILCFFKQASFIVYAILCFVIGVSLYFFVRYCLKLREEEPVGTNPRYKKYARWHSIATATLSGIFGAQTIVLAKSLMQLLSTSIDGDNQFIYWEPYILFLGTCVAIFGQLHWLAMGLKYFDAIVMVPFFQVAFILGSVIAGGAFYGEFNGMSLLSIIFFPIGIIVVIIGVFFLSKHKSSIQMPKVEIEGEDDLEADEEENPAMVEVRRRVDSQCVATAILQLLPHERHEKPEKVVAARMSKGESIDEIGIESKYE